MKKANKIISLLILLGLSFLFSVNGVKAGSYVETTNGRYEVIQNVETNNLDYGVTQRKDKAQTQSLQIKPTVPLDQQVNVLEVPTNTLAKIVVWGTHSKAGWVRNTVVNFAKDFEAKNPGWVVLAAVNGDFFDINSKFDLPEQTNGPMLQDGELVRSVNASGNQIVGFTNDGTANSLIGYKTFQTSGFKLSIYDENDKIIATYDIAKTNAAPGENEISVYFATQKKVQENKWEVTPSLLPNTAGREFIVENAIKALPQDANNFYGIGVISNTDTEFELMMGQFGIVSNNTAVNEMLGENVKIRVQRNVVGDYAAATSITGAGYRMLYQGEEVVSTNLDRHPRTIVGKKADGTVVLVTVDGRQATQGMNGVIYSEMAAVMKYYGCVEAYNLDGGGSTTMIIRDGKGGFRIMNSPSDGSERRDSNAILVVAPELSLKTERVTDTEVEFSYPKTIKGYTINKVNVTIDDVTKEMVDNKVVFDNLTPKLNYVVTYSYEMVRNGQTATVSGKSLEFTTGRVKPQIRKFECKIKGDEYTFNVDIYDPDETIDLISLNYENGIKFISLSKKTYTYNKTDIKGATEFTLTIIYNLRSSVLKNEELTQTITAEVVKDTGGGSSSCNFGAGQMVTYFIGLSATLGTAFIVLKARKH